LFARALSFFLSLSLLRVLSLPLSLPASLTHV
jgi:hypothetical protein